MKDDRKPLDQLAAIANEFTKPTFKTFFASEELADIGNNAGTTMSFDYDCILGDTIKEKYESVYCKLVELTNVLIRKGAKGYFWIAASPEIISMFECCTAGFFPTSCNELGIMPMGLPVVTYHGSLSYKWRLYSDTMMERNTLIIGCNDEREGPNSYGKMTIHNFII
jgi:hypothetical protein